MSMIRYTIVFLVTVAFFCLPLYLRTLYESNVALTYAVTHRDSTADMSAMFASLKKAVSWSAPFNRAADQAKEVLIRDFIADESQPKTIRLQAARALYEGLMKSRNILQNKQELRRAKEYLRAIAPEYADAPYIRLNKTQPNFSYQIAAQGAFWLWIVSVAYLVFYGFTSTGEIISRPLFRGTCCALSSFFLWCYLLYGH